MVSGPLDERELKIAWPCGMGLKVNLYLNSSNSAIKKLEFENNSVLSNFGIKRLKEFSIAFLSSDKWEIEGIMSLDISGNY
jgi:hypothetical protein